MKYATILAFALGAYASVTSAPSAAAIPTGVTPAMSCVLACNAGDVTCQASCEGIARPNASQAIDTNQCAANCDQGDGSADASKAYAQCVAGCINSLFPSSQTAFVVGAAAASSSASAGSGTTSATATASTGSRATDSVTGTGASAQKTAAADTNSARIAGAGLAGLLAIFAV